jgi:hypothetical protein
MRPAGVGHRAGRRVRAGPGVETADGEGPLISVVVPGQHQVDLVGVEERQPLPPDAQVGPVACLRRRARALVQLDDDPVDRSVAAGGRQGRLEPSRLRAAGVAAHVPGGARRHRRTAGRRGGHQRRRAGDERARAGVGDVVSAQADEQHGAHPERVPPPFKAIRAVGRQRVPGQIGGEPLLPVAELKLVVAGHRHPRPVRRRRLGVDPEVPPDLRQCGRVQGRWVQAGRVQGGRVQGSVGEVGVEQVEQRLEGLYRAHRVRGLAVVSQVRRAEVTEAGEPEGGPSLGCCGERGAERVGRVGVIVSGDRVPVGRAWAQPAHPCVVGPGDRAAARVGAGTLGRGDDSLADPDPGPDRLAGRGP